MTKLHDNAAPAADLDAGLKEVQELYLAEAEQAARDASPDTPIPVEVARVLIMGAPFLVLELALRGFELRISIGKIHSVGGPQADFRALLHQRIAEALAQADRFVDRLAEVRTKVETMLEGDAGMRLVSLRMTPRRVQVPFDWHGERLDAGVEYMGDMFNNVVEPISEFTAEAMGPSIRSLVKEHRHHVARKEKLDAKGAVCEIDAEAERLIGHHGFAVGKVVGQLLERQKLVLENGDGDPLPLVIAAGRVSHANHAHLQPVATRFVKPEEIAAL